MAHATRAGSGVRLIELLAALSLGTDLGMGQPMEHVLRQTFIALRLAEALNLSPAERGVVGYSSMLAWVGCHVDAYEQAKWFGDDQALKGDMRLVDLGKPAESAAYVLAHIGAGRPLLQRARVAAGFLGDGRRALTAMLENHWLAADALAERLALGQDVRDSVEQTFERWDGKGSPRGVSGEQLLLSSRLITLADVVEIFHRIGGPDAAIAVAKARSGTQFDPALVELFCAQAPGLLGELETLGRRDPFLDLATAGPQLTSEAFDSALEAIADFVDLKSPYTIGHSRAVADLATDAARLRGWTDADRQDVRRAGLVHDLGRIGVSNAVWDKSAPLTQVEADKMRLHPYLTERMLASCRPLVGIAGVAVQHHERLDGSGYPRGLSGDALSAPGRLLAAADAYQAKTEPRPHRPAYSPAEAAGWLQAEVRAGRLDGDAVDAVLGAIGHRVRRRRAWPAGLTTREVEVLRLLARGCSNKQIAQQLVISPGTAGRHVEHIYAKLEVSNRAMATVFAMRHGLLPELAGPSDQGDSQDGAFAR